MSVYHFTDTARLPWILDAGELKPGANAVGDFPEPEFVWATTCEHGDDTASGGRHVGGYRSGDRWLVRFTLRDEDFELWPDITRNYPAWTASHIARLEKRGNPALWRARVGPLPRAAWQAIHVRSYQQPRWEPIPLNTPVYYGTMATPAFEGFAKVVKVGNRDFPSVQMTLADGRTAYAWLEQ
jgi:hypothetical protein